VTGKLIIFYKSSLVFVESVAQLMVLWVLTLSKIQKKNHLRKCSFSVKWQIWMI